MTGAKLLGYLGAAWGISGIFLLLVCAVYRLSAIALNAFTMEFQWQHWLLLIANTVFMAYNEGYKGFQLAFAPRVAARARYLLQHPQLLHVVFAPLFCMGYFYTTRRRLITAYGLLLGILILIVIFQQLSQPWRGIMDAGVVVGLSWGLVSLAWFCFFAMVAESFDYAPETPHDTSN